MSFRDTFYLLEALDQPYPYKNTFKTIERTDDWDGDGEEYSKDVLDNLQVVHFKSDDGTPYIWYAKQNIHNDHFWDIAFGLDKGRSEEGGYKLDIELTNRNDSLRVLATILAITNSFIEWDEEYEVRYLHFTSKGEKRTKFYLNVLVPRIQKFEIDHVEHGPEASITLIRNF